MEMERTNGRRGEGPNPFKAGRRLALGARRVAQPEPSTPQRRLLCFHLLLAKSDLNFVGSCFDASGGREVG